MAIGWTRIGFQTLCYNADYADYVEYCFCLFYGPQDAMPESIKAFFSKRLLATFSGHHLYEVPPSMQVEMSQTAKTSFNGLMPLLIRKDVLNYDSRRINWLIFEYDLPNDDIMHYYNLLKKQFVKHHDRHIVVGITSTNTVQGSHKYVVLVRKEDYATITASEVSLDGVMPVSSYCKGKANERVQSQMVSLFNAFSSCIGKFVCGMEMETTGITYSYEHLLNITKELKDTDMMRLFANIALTAEDDRTELHWSLLKVERRIMAHRSLAKTPDAVIFQNKIHGIIQSVDAFVPGWQSLPVSLADASIIGASATTLGEWMGNPTLHQNVSLLMRGATRCGKSELSKLIAMIVAMQYSNTGNAHILFLTTIEAAKDCKDYMAPGVPIILDDIDPSDTSQLVHTSLGMWKAILQGTNPFTTRARNQDINWCRRQPKIITTNAPDVDSWLGKMGITSDRSHVAAIEMRLADCEIPGSLWANPMQPNPEVALIGRKQSVADAFSSFCRMF
jgi:hypothetical protein